MHIPSKTKVAFDFSAEAIRPNRHGNIFLWTFTFAEALDVEEGRRRWSHFLDKIRKRKKYFGFCGLRVFELHPGGHGLHIHVLTHCFLLHRVVREIWKSCGGGFVWVVPIPANRAKYAGKYLRKSGRPICFKGVRMWAAFGGMDHTRVKDVQVDSPWKRTYEFLAATVRTACGKAFRQLRWHERLRAVENVLTNLPWYWSLPYSPLDFNI